MLEKIEDDITVTSVDDFPQLLKQLDSDPDWDLILVDLLMPGSDGAQSVTKLRALSPSTPVVVVSAVEDPVEVEACFENGAAGYMPKTLTPDIMKLALHMVLAGGQYVPPMMLGRQDAKTSGRMGLGLDRNTAEYALTRRQLEVLSYLVQGKGNAEIARNMGVAEGTVKSHVYGVMKVLGVSNRTEAALQGRQLLQGESA